MSRRPPVAHRLIDMDPVMAVVRCDDDLDTFTRLAAEEVFVGQGVDRDLFEIAPPEWRWFRIIPCGPSSCGEHAWHIEVRGGPGAGNWRGSYVRLVRKEEK